MPDARTEALLNALAATAEEVSNADRLRDNALARRRALIKELFAVSTRAPIRAMEAATGMKKARLYQIRDDRNGPSGRASAG